MGMWFRIIFLVVATQLMLSPSSANAASKGCGGPYCISAPDPDLSKLQQGSTAGHGECLLKIDKKTGHVTEVGFTMDPGSQMLKATVVLGFMQWRFQPGKVKHVTVGFEYSRRSGFVCHYKS